MYWILERVDVSMSKKKILTNNIKIEKIMATVKTNHKFTNVTTDCESNITSLIDVW